MPARTMIRTLDVAVIGLVVLAIAIIGLFAWAARVADGNAFAMETTIVERELRREVQEFAGSLPRETSERARWVAEAPNFRMILRADLADRPAESEALIGRLVAMPESQMPLVQLFRALTRFEGSAKEPEFALIGPPSGEVLAAAALLPGSGASREIAITLIDHTRLAAQLSAYAIELVPLQAPGIVPQGANGHLVLAGYDGNAIGVLGWVGRRVTSEGAKQVLPIVIAIVFLSTLVLLGMRRQWLSAKAAFERDLDRVEHMAGTDPLTGLPNRRALFRHLDAISESGHVKGSACVLMLDLDGFKWINDQFGHDTGDQVISQAASVFRQELGADAFVARLGGDEFVVVLQGSLGDRALTRLHAHLTEALQRGITICRSGVKIGLSMGAVSTVEHRHGGEELLKLADIAVYAAKAGGRGSAVFFHPSMRLDNRYRRTLQRELRAALLTGELLTHHQPIVDALSGAVVGYESLVRWKHSYRGMLMPSEFIPQIEETDIIVPLGEYVLDRALSELGPVGDCRISVNATSRQLLSPGFTTHVVDALARHNVKPSRLCLELTETSLVIETDRLANVMEELRGLGVKFAIDDFGVGYSSLSYLLRFRFDVLKIDRDFIIALDDKPESPMIITSIVSLARSLGMQVVGEGIETAAQQRFLASAGCSMLQGFLFSPPRPIGELGLAPAPGMPQPVVRNEAA